MLRARFERWCRVEAVWERSFVAVSVLCGASIEEAMAALPDGAEAWAPVAEVAAKLRDPRRAVRAQGMAVVAQEVAVAIGEVTWR